MRNKTAIFVVGSCALALLVAGCGGGGSDSGSIDKASFVRQANEICERASGKLAAELSSIARREAANPKYTPAVLVERALVPGLEAELKELRALGIPSGGKQELQAFFKAVQKVINAAKADAETFASADSPYEAAELAGRKYGVSRCPIAPVEASS